MPDAEQSDQAVLDQLEQKPTKPTDTTSDAVVSESVREQAKDSGQRRWLRWALAGFVMALLFYEIKFLFEVVKLQGFGKKDETFVLNEWAFGFLTNGVLIQTFFSLRTIVTHLFPEGAKDFTR